MASTAGVVAWDERGQNGSPVAGGGSAAARRLAATSASASELDGGGRGGDGGTHGGVGLARSASAGVVSDHQVLASGELITHAPSFHVDLSSATAPGPGVAGTRHGKKGRKGGRKARSTASAARQAARQQMQRGGGGTTTATSSMDASWLATNMSGAPSLSTRGSGRSNPYDSTSSAATLAKLQQMKATHQFIRGPQGRHGLFLSRGPSMDGGSDKERQLRDHNKAKGAKIKQLQQRVQTLTSALEASQQSLVSYQNLVKERDAQARAQQSQLAQLQQQLARALRGQVTEGGVSPMQFASPGKHTASATTVDTAAAQPPRMRSVSPPRARDQHSPQADAEKRGPMAGQQAVAPLDLSFRHATGTSGDGHSPSAAGASTGGPHGAGGVGTERSRKSTVTPGRRWPVPADQSPTPLSRYVCGGVCGRVSVAVGCGCWLWLLAVSVCLCACGCWLWLWAVAAVHSPVPCDHACGSTGRLVPAVDPEALLQP